MFVLGMLLDVIFDGSVFLLRFSLHCGREHSYTLEHILEAMSPIAFAYVVGDDTH